MKRSLGLTAVILIAVLARLLPHPPNFAPITAMVMAAFITDSPLTQDLSAFSPTRFTED